MNEGDPVIPRDVYVFEEEENEEEMDEEDEVDEVDEVLSDEWDSLLLADIFSDYWERVLLST